MARQKMKGSLVYEILIVILTILLVGTILYPKSVWQKIDRDTMLCRDQMMRWSDAELLYLQGSEEANYDSSLVKVLNFVRYDSIWVTDSTLATLRDSFYVNVVRDFFRDYKDMATKPAMDSAFRLVEGKADSIHGPILTAILDTMFSLMYTCPTVKDTYLVSIIDTTAVKKIKISCPMTPEQVDSINSNFWFHVVGGGKVENHGYVENGEPSWKEAKRK